MNPKFEKCITAIAIKFGLSFDTQLKKYSHQDIYKIAKLIRALVLDLYNFCL